MKLVLSALFVVFSVSGLPLHASPSSRFVQKCDGIQTIGFIRAVTDTGGERIGYLASNLSGGTVQIRDTSGLLVASFSTPTVVLAACWLPTESLDSLILYLVCQSAAKTPLLFRVQLTNGSPQISSRAIPEITCDLSTCSCKPMHAEIRLVNTSSYGLAVLCSFTMLEDCYDLTMGPSARSKMRTVVASLSLNSFYSTHTASYLDGPVAGITGQGSLTIFGNRSYRNWCSPPFDGCFNDTKSIEIQSLRNDGTVLANAVDSNRTMGSIAVDPLYGYYHVLTSSAGFSSHVSLHFVAGSYIRELWSYENGPVKFLMVDVKQYRTLIHHGAYGARANDMVIYRSTFADAYVDSFDLEPGVVTGCFWSDSSDMRQRYLWTRADSLFEFDMRVPTDVDDDNDAEIVPESFALLINYPNPFNSNTVIPFVMSQRGYVRLSIFDILGREVALVFDDARPAGEFSVHWDGRDTDGQPVSSGVYFTRLTVDGVSQSRKMLLLK
jgi:hypothetical protein